jgi:parallel beta-helix repeat protein
VEGNKANANGEAGIESTFSSRNTLTSNTTRYNAHDGIILSDCSEFTLTGNTSNWNLMTGISLWYVYDSILTGNKTNSNGRHGTALFFECHGNTVQGNIAKKNGYVYAGGGYGYIDGYNPLHQVLDNTWLDNVCKRNFSGGSIHGDSSSSTGGELCSPQS